MENNFRKIRCDQYMETAANLPYGASKYRTIKRISDILLASVAVVLLVIPMLLIAVAVYADDPGKVIFAQYRIGLHGKTFLLYKFRTMRQNAPRYVAAAELYAPEKYITRVGKFLRRASLDELPQLFNILLGDMSLIGPRPLIPQEQYIHTLREKYGVYQIRPGMTGLAQINGRDKLSADEKVRYDVAYLKDFGCRQDISIILATLPGVLSGDGIIEGPVASERRE